MHHGGIPGARVSYAYSATWPFTQVTALCRPRWCRQDRGNGHPAGPAGHPSACSLLIEEPVRCVAEEVGLEVSQGHVPVDLQPVALVGDVTAVRVLDEHHLEHAGRPRR